MYHETIVELFKIEYHNEESFGYFIQFLKGMNGISSFPDIKQGISLALEEVLLQQQTNSKARTPNIIFTNLFNILRYDTFISFNLHINIKIMYVFLVFVNMMKEIHFYSIKLFHY